MKKNTRQHYVPRFYLREWEIKKDRVWIYPISGQKPFCGRVETVCFERGLYSHPTGDDDPLVTEKDLGKFEALFARVWPDIIDRAENPRTRLNLARFIALMYLRHPKRKGLLRALDSDMAKFIKDMEDHTVVHIETKEEKGSVTVGEIRKGLNDKHAVTTAFLDHMRSFVEELGQILFKRRWGVVFAPQDSFITTDCPVVLARANAKKANVGFRTPGSQVFFPFSPKRMLVIDDEWPHEFAHYKLTNPDVFNRPLALHAQRWIVATKAVPIAEGKIKQWRSELRRS